MSWMILEILNRLKLSTLLKLKSINQSSNKLKIDRGPKILKENYYRSLWLL